LAARPIRQFPNFLTPGTEAEQIPASALRTADRAGGPGWGGDACDIGAFEYGTREILFADGFDSGDTSAWSAKVP
jgi:hypothetical protein